MSTVMEIETALKELPLQDAQAIAQWLQEYLEEQDAAKTASAAQATARLPYYAARRRMVFGEKVLPNMVMGRDQERW